MKYITLLEFQTVSGLSDASLLRMLSDNRLDCRLDEKHGLMVNVAATSTKALIQSLIETQRDFYVENESACAERVSRIIAEHLGSILDEALARYLAELSHTS